MSLAKNSWRWFRWVLFRVPGPAIFPTGHLCLRALQSRRGRVGPHFPADVALFTCRPQPATLLTRGVASDARNVNVKEKRPQNSAPWAQFPRGMVSTRGSGFNFKKHIRVRGMSACSALHWHAAVRLKMSTIAVIDVTPCASRLAANVQRALRV